MIPEKAFYIRTILTSHAVMGIEVLYHSIVQGNDAELNSISTDNMHVAT